MDILDNESLISKIKTENEEKTHPCGQCGMSFSLSSSLLNHMKIHTGGKPYQCSKCDKAYAHQKQIERHMRKHIEKKPIQCQYCEEIFPKKMYLKRHLKAIHPKEKSYQCSQCGKVFYRNEHLRSHLQRHTGEKPYQCSLCNKFFAEKNNLLLHMRIHTGEKPYQCNQCGIFFSQSSSLKTHIKTHTGEKPHQCFVCGKAFIRKTHLTRHQRSHTGEKPYQCTFCDKAFSYDSNLRKHTLIHTKRNQEESTGIKFPVKKRGRPRTIPPLPQENVPDVAEIIDKSMPQEWRGENDNEEIKVIKEEVDPDRHFLMGLMPELKTLSKDAKNEFKKSMSHTMKILQHQSDKFNQPDISSAPHQNFPGPSLHMNNTSTSFTYQNQQDHSQPNIHHLYNNYQGSRFPTKLQPVQFDNHFLQSFGASQSELGIPSSYKPPGPLVLPEPQSVALPEQQHSQFDNQMTQLVSVSQAHFRPHFKPPGSPV